VDTWSAADVPVKRFHLTPFSNLLSEFVETEVRGEVAIAIAAIVVKFVLCALNGDDQGFHNFGQVACCDPLEELDGFVGIVLAIAPFGAELKV
jgi:hypothetical protein